MCCGLVTTILSDTCRHAITVFNLNVASIASTSDLFSRFDRNCIPRRVYHSYVASDRPVEWICILATNIVKGFDNNRAPMFSGSGSSNRRSPRFRRNDTKGASGASGEGYYGRSTPTAGKGGPSYDLASSLYK